MDTEAVRSRLFPVGARVTLAQLEGAAHQTFHEIRATEPVSWLPVTGRWWVTSRAEAVAVLRDPVTFTVDDPRFSTAQVVGPSMLSLDGAEHDRHRRPFSGAFRLADVRHRLGDRVEAEARRLVSNLVPVGGTELRRELAAPLAVRIISDALGLSGVDPVTVLGWYSAIVDEVSRITSGRIQTPGAGAGAEAFAALRGKVTATVDDSPGSLVASIAAAGTLADAELAANVAVVMFGGIETSEGMTASALWHLLSHPAVLDDVRSRPAMIALVVEESLRLEPAAAIVDRYATRDVTLAGAEIAAGDAVTVSLSAANRDPAVFTDPDCFDPDRENTALHLSFVQGPHTCLGRHLARMETTAAIRAVLDLMADVRLDPHRSSPPRGLVFRKPPSVVATWRT
jgi:cytochrome P450